MRANKNLLLCTRSEYRQIIAELEKENFFLESSCEGKDKYIDHLLERIEQLEASIISGGAIVPDAKPFEG